MKKIFGIVTFIAFFLVCVALNVIMFLTLPEARIHTNVFWFVWAFTFPLNLVMSFVSLAIVCRSENESLIFMPVMYGITIAAFVAYVLAAFKILYTPFITTLQIPILTETIITVIYLIVILYALLGMRYVSQNQKETKKKVLYVRTLYTDLESCLPTLQDEAMAASLRALAEAIRFSDPMSHPSLSTIESALADVVSTIVVDVQCGSLANIPASILRANALLEQRNARCKILK